MKNKDDHRQDYKHILEESAQDLYENAPCGYLSSLPDGTIVKINNTLLKWLGYQREEILYIRKFQDLLSIGGKIFYETHHAPLLQMQGFVTELNYDIIQKNRQLLPVLINSMQVKDDEGEVVLVRTTIFNYTERKKYERELLLAKKKAEQATKAKSEFLSTISHEIRTPMNAIIGITNLLLKSNLSGQQVEYLNILKFSSENLLNLINDILDFSKIEAGKVVLEEKNFNIKELVYSIIYSLHVKAEEKGLAIHLNIDEQLPAYLLGDPVKIGQILTNLLSNAIKFTEQGYVSVDLKVKEVTQDVVSVDFCVKDTGIGISKEGLSKIFEEFTQESYEVNVKYGGTGLGLAICKKLLALYGTEMSVESAEGKGTAFFFNLCMKPGHEAPKVIGTDEKITAQKQSIQECRVLLAEDNPINVFVASQFLKDWGVNFDVAENGRQVIEKVKQEDYHVILMDLQMPELDGYEASRAIRNLPEEKYQKLPIIAFSASTKFDLQERLAQANITDFISKPFNPKELYDKIVLHASPGFSNPRLDTQLKPSTEDTQAIVSDSASEVINKKSQVISLDNYITLTSHKRESLIKLLTMTIGAFTNYKSSFKSAFTSKNTEEVDALSHKIKATINLLQAEQLQAAIDNGRKMLQENKNDDIAIQEAVQHIIAALEQVIVALQEALKKYK